MSQASASVVQERPLLLSVRDVAALLGLGVRTVWRMVAQGTFPGPTVSIGERIRRWRRADVEAWVNKQAEQGE